MILKWTCALRIKRVYEVQNYINDYIFFNEKSIIAHYKCIKVLVNFRRQKNF